MALRAVPDHPKFANLKAALGQPKGAVIGWLEIVWHFTGRFTPRGDIGKYSDQAIESWVEWNGKPGALIEALVKTGWVDRDRDHRLLIHDWSQHADKATKNALSRAGQTFYCQSVRTPYVQCTDMQPKQSTVYGLPEPVPVPEPVPEPEAKKPSRRKTASDQMKHSADPRHVACKEEIFAAYRSKNGVDPPWNGYEGKALGMLLQAWPKVGPEGIRKLLRHWAASNVVHGDRPGIWIPKLSSFMNGPIDRYNKPAEENGNGRSSETRPSPAKERVDGARRVLSRIAVERGLMSPDSDDGRVNPPLSLPGS